MTTAAVAESLGRFLGWLDRHGVESHDPYDLWGTRYGLLARRLYYSKSLLGLPLVAPLIAVETLVPGIRGTFVGKQRFATAEAQLIQGFLNLFACTREEKYLTKAESSAKAIEKGWGFCRALSHADETPKSVAIEPRTQLAAVEIYNFAEAITLGTLNDTIPAALTLARRLTGIAIRDYQLADGHFVTRVFRGGLSLTTPFLRWPQAQMFLALTHMHRDRVS